jgi:hypothetical protein
MNMRLKLNLLDKLYIHLINIKSLIMQKKLNLNSLQNINLKGDHLMGKCLFIYKIKKQIKKLYYPSY